MLSRPMLKLARSLLQVPDWMLSMKRDRRSDRRKLESRAPRRDTIATVSKYDVRKKRHRQFMINDSKKASGQT